MSENVYQVSRLILGHLKGTLSVAETRELELWLAAAPQNRSLFNQLTAPGSLDEDLRNMATVETAAARKKLVAGLFPPAAQHYTKNMRVRRLQWWAAAAILLLLTGIYTITHISLEQKSKLAVQHLPALAPGREGAILKLADGTEIVLDSLGNGVVARQDGTAVILKDGVLSYTGSSGTAGVTAYNTMQTPKGRQFHLQLPDGSGVWLNAASSIHYPVAFDGRDRMVTITGEAYFEIAPNAAMPFIVQVAGKETIQVMGTHFNVNAYDNEKSLNTTLLQGAIQVISGANKVTLKPGQQAQLAGAITVADNADIGKVMAWKNGAFNFENASLEEVMRQLERWYDIEVIYEKGIPETYFMGEMSRGMNLNDVLTTLEKTGVHFRMEEKRKLIVIP